MMKRLFLVLLCALLPLKVMASGVAGVPFNPSFGTVKVNTLTTSSSYITVAGYLQPTALRTAGTAYLQPANSNATWEAMPASVTDVAFQVRGRATSQTGDLLRMYKYSGGALEFSVSADGNVTMSGSLSGVTNITASGLVNTTALCSGGDTNYQRAGIQCNWVGGNSSTSLNYGTCYSEQAPTNAKFVDLQIKFDIRSAAAAGVYRYARVETYADATCATLEGSPVEVGVMEFNSTTNNTTLLRTSARMRAVTHGSHYYIKYDQQDVGANDVVSFGYANFED